MSDSSRVFGRRVGNMHNPSAPPPKPPRTEEQKAEDLQATKRSLEVWNRQRQARISSTRQYRVSTLQHKDILM